MGDRCVKKGGAVELLIVCAVLYIAGAERLGTGLEKGHRRFTALQTRRTTFPR